MKFKTITIRASQFSTLNIRYKYYQTFNKILNIKDDYDFATVQVLIMQFYIKFVDILNPIDDKTK